MINPRTSGILAGCVALLTAASASAQHRHGSGHTDIARHRGHVDVVQHHGSNFGHSNWNYVVPHHDAQHHSGTYYVQDNSYYYTPTPVVRVAPTIIPTAELHRCKSSKSPFNFNLAATHGLKICQAGSKWKSTACASTCTTTTATTLVLTKPTRSIRTSDCSKVCPW